MATHISDYKYEKKVIEERGPFDKYNMGNIDPEKLRDLIETFNQHAKDAESKVIVSKQPH